MTHTVSVGGEFRHDVVIGARLLEGVAGRLAAQGIAPPTTILVVEDANVRVHADVVIRSLDGAGYPTARVSLLATEAAKSMPAVEAIWQAALTARLGRRDAMVVIGGGLVGDVGGFAAASYLRGVRFLGIPTTLLAMVDASTGGKTGINLPLPGATELGGGGLGKNLAGAFWPPVEVLVDPAVLTTLPTRELSSGLAECIKHAFLDGADHLAWLSERIDRVLARDGAVTTEVVARSVAVKARVVTEDPRERSVRALLNFGHTFGHAIETLPEIDLTHGEAVAIGMIAACSAGEATRGLPRDATERLRTMLRMAHLPTALDFAGARQVRVDEVLHRMGFDKKSEGGSLRFVVPAAIGDLDPKAELAPRVVVDALQAIGCVA